MAVAAMAVSATSVDVWFPAGYAPESDTRYPVVYMQDGQNLFDPKIAFGGNSAYNRPCSRYLHSGYTQIPRSLNTPSGM